jgi:putative peptide zinc metalloprotease protein
MLLPHLREELDLLPSPALSDGQPNWTLHDPVRQQFFCIDGPTLEMLQRWEMGDPDLIAQDVCSHRALTLTHEDVVALAEFLVQHQLVRAVSTDALRTMTAPSIRVQDSSLKCLLQRDLVFRIPMIKSDAWLAHCVPMARWFYRWFFVWTILLALAAGLIQVLWRWDVFSASLLELFS